MSVYNTSKDSPVDGDSGSCDSISSFLWFVSSVLFFIAIMTQIWTIIATIKTTVKTMQVF